MEGEGASARLLSTKEKCRRSTGATLIALRVPREERRVTNQRREERHWGVIDRALLIFRRKRMLVRVVNVSSGGLMIECEIEPRIGESVVIELEGHGRYEAVVRWIRGGRLGLDAGEGSISVG
jgi:hypothetical protein